jgi:hypothetical protein
MTKLLGALPKDTAHNGLPAIERSLLAADDGDEFTLLVRVAVAKRVESVHSGEVEAVCQVVDVQPVLPGDLDLADRLLRAAREAHTAQPELEIDGLRVQQGTGEILDGPWPAGVVVDGSGVVRVPSDDGTDDDQDDLDLDDIGEAGDVE